MLNDPAFRKEFTQGIVSLMMETVAPLKGEIVNLRAALVARDAQLKRHSDAIDELLARPSGDVRRADLEQVRLSAIDDVTPTLQGITERVETLMRRIEDLPAPRDGKDADMDAVNEAIAHRFNGLTAEIRATVDEMFAAMPKPKDGADGPPGKDGDQGAPGKDAEVPWDYLNEQLSAGGELLQQSLTKLITEKFDALPKPRDGVSPSIEDISALVLKSIKLPVDGKDGRDGVDGKNGEDGLSPPVDEIAQRVLDAIPLPKDGRDGVGIAGTVIDRQGNLIITKTDGTIHNAGVVTGRDGRDGKDGDPGAKGEPGRDGFGFDDVEAVEEPLRFGFAFRRGKEVKEFWYQKSTLADWDYEIWREGTEYPRGAVVTIGGSLYVCKTTTKTRPETEAGSRCWRLAVKCGRNGANGKDGPAGPPGPIGPQGKPGQSFNFDGRAL